MSWGRLTHPRDLVNVGDEIQVKVLKFDKEKQRVSLGFKQLTPDPWLDATERYPVGAKVTAACFPSPTTARSSSSSRASKAWFTSLR
jgi:ribosomal protein S1